MQPPFFSIRVWHLIHGLVLVTTQWDFDESVEVSHTAESNNLTGSAKHDIEAVDRDGGFEIIAEPKLEKPRADVDEAEAVAEAKIEKLKEDDGDVEEKKE